MKKNPFDKKPAKLAPQGSFGWHLKQIRESRGLSQSQLGLNAEYDHSYVSRLEAGTRDPTRDTVIRLGKAMEIPEDDDRLEQLLHSAGFRTMQGQIHFASPAIWELNREYPLAAKKTQQEIDAFINIALDGIRRRRFIEGT